MVRLYLAVLMPGYTHRGALGLLATLPRMLILLPPWLAATIYVAALSVAIAAGAGALLSLQVRLGSALGLENCAAAFAEEACRPCCAWLVSRCTLAEVPAA